MTGYTICYRGDSLMLVQAIRYRRSVKNRNPMVSYFVGIVEECVRLLETLPNVSLFFVKRSANGMAH